MAWSAAALVGRRPIVGWVLRDQDWNYFGGCNSLFSQPVALSVFSGSGPSQSKHWNVRCHLPLGGSARIKKAPQWGQVGPLACPIAISSACPKTRRFHALSPREYLDSWELSSCPVHYS